MSNTDTLKETFAKVLYTNGIGAQAPAIAALLEDAYEKWVDGLFEIGGMYSGIDFVFGHNKDDKIFSGIMNIHACLDEMEYAIDTARKRLEELEGMIEDEV